MPEQRTRLVGRDEDLCGALHGAVVALTDGECEQTTMGPGLVAAVAPCRLPPEDPLREPADGAAVRRAVRALGLVTLGVGTVVESWRMPRLEEMNINPYTVPGLVPGIVGTVLAILGLTRSKMSPVWDGEAFQPRNMQPLSLSYDHRAIDGALAARFCATLKHLLGDVRRLML